MSTAQHNRVERLFIPRLKMCLDKLANVLTNTSLNGRWICFNRVSQIDRALLYYLGNRFPARPVDATIALG